MNQTIRRLTAQAKANLSRHRLVWGVLFLGIFLLLLPIGSREEEGEITPESSAQAASFDLDATENRLAAALSKIDGAGEVTVVLTLQDGPRILLAQDAQQKEDQETTETVILSKGSGTQDTVTVQELYPKYQGALVVCPGGDDPGVRLGLTQAVSALTGLGADKIVIRKGT
jgi:stage III sporulation protein AG